MRDICVTSSGRASFIVSLTQIGYALGLFFLVPLADQVENRRLMRVLEQYEVSPGSASTCINALYLANHRGSSRINVFITFLQQILAP